MLSLVPHLPHLSNEGRAALGLVKQGVVPTCPTCPTFSNREVCSGHRGRYGAHTPCVLAAESVQEGQVGHDSLNASTLLTIALPYFRSPGGACPTSTRCVTGVVRRGVAIGPRSTPGPTVQGQRDAVGWPFAREANYPKSLITVSSCQEVS